MRNVFRLLVAGILAVLMTSPIFSAETEKTANKPPVAKKVEKKFTIHDDTRVDNYFWLRQKESPEVLGYLEAENAYADEIMKPAAALHEALYNEMLGRIKQTDLSVPYKLGDYFYYSRTVEGKQYPIHCRRKGSLDASEEVALDLNEMAKGLKYLALGAMEISDDGNLLAYSTDITGFRQYTLQVKDLRTGEILPDRVEKTLSVVWGADGKTLFYTVEDHAKRPYRLYRHILGGKDDALVYEEKDELYRIFAERSRSRDYLFLTSASSTTSEVRYIEAQKPDGELRLVLPRKNEHEYYLEHHGDQFYILTNDEAKNFRLVHAPVADPQKKNWVESIAHRRDVMLEGVDLFANHLVVSERKDGIPGLRVIDLRSNASHRVEFPEGVYSAFPDTNKNFATPVIRIRYQSFITPLSIFDYDMNEKKRTLLKETEVLGGYDRTVYVSERIYATTTDKTRVPISLLYRKGMERNGKNPLLLYGYGSYGSSQSPNFNSNRLSLLDRGMVFAVAHIRGGGDLGKEWHDTGKMLLKKNTFADFIAAAEHLIAEKYTSKDHLAIQGGSAGGLLTGAVTNMRPDLFRVVLSQVPFVDVINTMLDASLPLTVGEYLEWGNPNVKAEYEYIKSYCPYMNIAAKKYPTMLVKASLNDSQVMYWEAAKYVAKLRAHKTDENPLVLKTNMGAGHGGSSGRYDRLREIAFDYAFLLSQLGVAE